MTQLKKAYKCGTCKFFDRTTKQCTIKDSLSDYDFTEDDFNNTLCIKHVLLSTGEPTNGYYMFTPKERQKVFFTSDTHFTHYNILRFHPNRRNACGITEDEYLNDKNTAIQKHDQWLINLWNNTVKREDTIYCLGDFCLDNREHTEKILRQLKGKKHLITGNHDKSLRGLENYFESVSQIKEAKFTNNQFKFIPQDEPFCVEMSHYPMLTWNRRNHGTVHVHGHCHGSLDTVNDLSKELRVDVGLDSKLADYNFIEIEQLYNYFNEMKTKANCDTFEQYTTSLINKGGIKG